MRKPQESASWRGLRERMVRVQGGRGVTEQEEEGLGFEVGEEGAQFEVEEGAEVGEAGLVLHGFFGLGGVLWI
jgi:hypothetical protein